MTIGLLREKEYTEREYEGSYDSSHSWKMTLVNCGKKSTQREIMKAHMIVHIHEK